MEYGLDVVPVGVEHEGAVVAIAVFGSRAGRPVVPAPGSHGSGVEGVDLVGRVRGEGDVELTTLLVPLRDREVVLLLCSERDAAVGVARRAEVIEAERRQRLRVEAPAPLQVVDADREVVDDHAPRGHAPKIPGAAGWLSSIWAGPRP